MIIFNYIIVEILYFLIDIKKNYGETQYAYQ